MTFKEFLTKHKTLWPAVNFAPGSSGFIDTMRLYNGFAIAFPDQFTEVVQWISKNELAIVDNKPSVFELPKEEPANIPEPAPAPDLDIQPDPVEPAPDIPEPELESETAPEPEPEPDNGKESAKPKTKPKSKKKTTAKK
jgi:hypothetical protein